MVRLGTYVANEVKNITYKPHADWQWMFENVNYIERVTLSDDRSPRVHVFIIDRGRQRVDKPKVFTRCLRCNA
jgi:hypothetical protein